MNLESFSIRLRELMESEQTSKRGLSKKIQVDRCTILNWCKGKYLPRYDTLIKLADFYGVSTDYLLGLENECFDEYYCPFSIEEVSDVYKTRVKETLLSLKMSEYRFAKLLGVEQSVISNWKKQYSLPDTSRLIQIAGILGTSLDFLLGRVAR